MKEGAAPTEALPKAPTSAPMEQPTKAAASADRNASNAIRTRRQATRTLRQMTPVILKEKLSNPIFRTIGETADGLGLEVYAVGGFVRDIFLGRHSADLDFVAVGSGIALARAVAERLGKKGKLTVYANYGPDTTQGYGA